MKNTSLLFKLIKFINIFNRNSVYLGGKRILTQTAYGHRMILDSNDLSLTPNIATFGLWEPDITQVFLNTLEDGMKVIEIGANIGYFTLLASSSVGNKGKVFAFEANPSTFKILHNNLDINGLLGKVELVNKAVYDKSTKLKFNSLSNHQGGSSIASFSTETLNYFNDTCTTIDIDAVSLDDYFKDEFPLIDFMKIDAEGSEPFIFRGMRNLLKKQKKINIICEFNQPLIKGVGEDPADFLEYIKESGFEIRKISRNGRALDCNFTEILNEVMCELFLTKK